MKEFLGEFKKFALKGNAIDLAVGVVIGAAFGKIVDSLVGDIVMPSVGVLTGGVNFSGLSITVGEAIVPYGKFIQAVVVFTIVALALFLIVKAINTLRREDAASSVQPKHSPETELLTEIRDLLKSK